MEEVRLVLKTARLDSRDQSFPAIAPDPLEVRIPSEDRLPVFPSPGVRTHRVHQRQRHRFHHGQDGLLTCEDFVRRNLLHPLAKVQPLQKFPGLAARLMDQLRDPLPADGFAKGKLQNVRCVS
jgi:hypothetical protein